MKKRYGANGEQLGTYGISVISSFSTNVCPYFTICRNKRYTHHPIFHNDHFNMLAFGMFVNITETDTGARIHVQKLVNHVCGVQIFCSTAKTQWRTHFFSTDVVEIKDICIGVAHSIGHSVEM